MLWRALARCGALWRAGLGCAGLCCAGLGFLVLWRWDMSLCVLRRWGEYAKGKQGGGGGGGGGCTTPTLWSAEQQLHLSQLSEQQQGQQVTHRSDAGVAVQCV